MKRTYLLFISLLVFTITHGQTPANDPHWLLLWEDQFTSFNSTKWVKAEYCDHNGEPQLYTADNVDIWNGKLRIHLLDEDANCINTPPTTYVCGDCNLGTHNYTSGWINTNEAYNMEFGYVEARIQFPYGNGLWPAFWLWSFESRYEEIDIAELFPGKLEKGTNVFYGQRHDQYINTSHLHYGVTNGSTWTKISQDYIYPINDYFMYHTYGIEWSPNKIIIYVDGIVVNNIQNPQISDPKHIIFNIAINNALYDEIILPYTGIPATMLVDWIKVYTLNSDCNNSIWTCNYDFNNHDFKVKNVISIGGSGCLNSLTNGQNITLRAKDFVIINGDFTVPTGAELYIDCNSPCY
jgi:beta-glucanase (GH16 family)